MKLFKNNVGRPSNETKKKRRLFVFGTITLSVAAGLLVAMLISSISINNLSGKALGNYSGDIDGDGLVTQKDVKTISDFASNLKKYSNAQKKIADMNKDGKITIIDAKLALNIAKQNYTIVFNNSRADNGSGKMESVEVGKNGIKLPKCEFTEKGKVFRGWIMQRNQDGKYYGKIDNKSDWYTSNELFGGKKNGVYLLLKDESALNPLTKKVKAGTKITLYATWEDAKNGSKSNSKSSSKSNSKNSSNTKKVNKNSSNNGGSQRRCENSGKYWYKGKCYSKKPKVSTNCPAIKDQKSCDGYINCKWGFGNCKTV